MSESVQNPMDRLRFADPVTDSSYRHADPGALLARIVAQPRVAKVNFAQGLRLRVASAAAAAALVSVAGIAALQSSGPSLASLALGAKAPTTSTLNSAKAPVGSMMRLAENFKFIAGPDLTSGAGTAPSYLLTAPSDLVATSQQIAAHFGISGDPSATPALNSYWTIGDTSGSGPNVGFSTDGAVLSWAYYSAASSVVISTPPAKGTSPSSSPTSVPPTTAVADAGLSNDTALADAQSQLSALGVSGPFGTPAFANYSASDGTSLTNVTLPWDGAGPGSYWSYSFTFDGSGNLVDASGIDTSVTVGSDYPLLSEVAGVDALQTQQSANFNPGGPIMYSPTAGAAAADGSTTTTSNSGGVTPGSAPTSGSPTDPSTIPPTTTTTDTLPTKTITLDSATIQYGQYTLSDGSSVMLPQYLYSGDDGSQWSVLAVDPAYVQLSPSVAKPMMY